MIILITGATHTGKTRLAHLLMTKKNIPYLSQDHLKMGLIRSGYTILTPDAPDTEMTEYLWPVTREMIKTAIENDQDLIIEGCYITFDWKNDFETEYLANIKYICLCFSDTYIDEHYSDIMGYESCIENRLDDGYCSIELLKSENARFMNGCINNSLPYIIIEDDYEKSVEGIAI